MSLMMTSDAGISAFPDGDNIFHWTGTITGGEGTVYEGMQYKLSLKFPTGYPYEPPQVTFTTPCFHPNVDQYGNICLDILKARPPRARTEPPRVAPRTSQPSSRSPPGCP